jgi:nucleotide-binding universal stress UspA family protein
VSLAEDGPGDAFSPDSVSMYAGILFPTDGSEPAEWAFEYALELASEHDATIHVLHVVDTGQDTPAGKGDGVTEELEAQGEAIVNEAAKRATERDLTAVSNVLHGDPYGVIGEYGARSDVELVVMPTHGRRGLKRYLLGSVTERVITTAEVPAVAVDLERNRPFTYPCRDIFVPTDGSRGAERAVSEGIELATETGATIRLLHVVETGGLGPNGRSLLEEDELTTRAKEIVADAIETAESGSIDTVESEIAFGTPSAEIRSYIEANGIDLAVLGTHGRSVFSRYVMGGVSANVVRTSPVPVMWVRAPAAGQ